MKRNKLIKAFLAIALVAALCAGAQVAAFAADPTTGTEDEPADITITKTLQMPVGTTTPEATFNFVFTPVSVDGKTTTDDLATMPAITGASVSFTAADTGDSTSGVKIVTDETDAIFKDITWPHAGEYVYTVTEAADSYTVSDGETMTYSDATYNVTVYVANGDNGLYIAAIGATVTIADNEGQEVGEKVDATPEGSSFVFTNTFVKNSISDNPAAGTLFASKTVEGDYGDLTQYFDYTVTLTQPSVITGTSVYKVYVLEGEDNTVVTSEANATSEIIRTDDTYGNYIAVTSGVLATIHLKHGQSLSFVGAAVGTSFTITEVGASNYTPSLDLTVDGTVIDIADGAQGAGIATGNQLIGEGVNTADFVNTRATPAITGIFIESLPYLIMVVLAAGAVGLFVVIKTRKQAYSSKK